MKKYLTIFLLLIIFLSSCAYYNTFYNAKQYYKSAERQIEKSKNQDQLSAEIKQNLDKAINKSKKVLYKYPDSRWADDAQYLIARSSYYKRNYSLAKKEFEKFLYDYPESDLRIQANIWYGKTLWNLGQKEVALQQWESTANKIQTDEVLGELYYLMGESFREREQIDSAITYYQKVNDLKKSERRVEALFNLIDIKLKNNRNNAAANYLKELSEMVLLPKELNKMQVLQIEIYRKQGKYEKARSVINKKLNSENFKDIWGALELQLALIYKEEGNLEKAISRLLTITENYKKTKESAHAFYILGDIHAFTKQDYKKALTYYSKVAEEYKDSEFTSESNHKKDILTRFQKKNKEFDETQKLINRIENKVDTSFAKVEIDSAASDSLSREELKQKVEQQKKEQTRNIDTLATYEKYYQLQYEIAEIYYFDLNLQDTAKTIYRNIANSYEYNPYVSKAIYALYYINQKEDNSKRAEYYKNRLAKEYPDSPYLAFIKNGEVPLPENERKARKLFHKAEKYIEDQPDSSIIILKDILEDYPATEYTQKGVLGLSWIYQNKLYAADSALKWYKYYQKQYPKGKAIEYVKSNIAKLQQVKDALKPDTTSDSLATVDSTSQQVRGDSLSTSQDSLSAARAVASQESLPEIDSSAVQKEPGEVKEKKQLPKDKEPELDQPMEAENEDSPSNKKIPKEPEIMPPDSNRKKSDKVN